MASAQPQPKTEPTNEAANIISALGKAFKGQNGAPLTGDQLAQWLHQNMAQLGILVKEGKLTQGQILAVRNQGRLRFASSSSVRAMAGSRGLLSFSFVALCQRDLWLTRGLLSFISISFAIIAQRVCRQA